MNPTEKDVDALIEKLASATRSPKGQYTADESYKKFQEAISKKKPKFRIFRLAASAAAVILLCITGWNVYTNLQPINIIIESTLAETKTIILPDGSEVVLNHFTTVRYPDRFKKGNRLVKLTGEAYFDVTHNPGKPFIVETSDVNVKVLGTQFNVEAYPNDPEIKTTLLEGSVEVSDGFGPRAILRPSESATYNKENKELTLNYENDAVGEIVWKDGSLIFPNITLAEISRQLSNHFGVTIQIDDPELKTLKITARFTNKESLPDILDLLKVAGDFEYKHTEQNTLLIYNN